MEKVVNPDWSHKKLNELGFVGRGKSRHRPRNDTSLYEGAYPFIQTGDIKAANFYISEYSQTYNEKGLSQSKLWEPNTLCITIAANIAETAILKIKACFPDSIVGFIADQKEADVRFIKYYIDTIKLSMQNVSKGTTQDNLSLDKLLTFDFLIPTLPTQRKIATILSAYDNLIENNMRRIKILEEIAQALYREWFVEFRFPGHETMKMVESELGMVPEEWEVKKLGELYRTSSGGTPSRKIAEYYGGTINWVKTKELNDNFLFKTEEKITDVGLQKSSAKIFPENTVIMAMYGATIGKLAILSQPAAINQACCAIIKIDDLFQHHYIFSFLLVNREKIFSLGAGAAQQNISQTVIQKMKILKPSDKIMKMFTEFVAPNFEHIKLLQLKNDNLRSTRDMLLPNLISGEVGVDNFNINIGRNR